MPARSTGIFVLATAFAQGCVVPSRATLPAMVGEFSGTRSVVEIESLERSIDVAFESEDGVARRSPQRCSTPCRLSVPSGRYIMVSRARGLGTFDRRTVDIDGEHVWITVAPPRIGSRVPGLVAMPLGSAAIGTGVGLIATGVIQMQPSCDRSYFTAEVICSMPMRSDGAAIAIGGAFSLLLGTAALAFGIGVHRASRTRVEIQYGPGRVLPARSP